MDEQRQSMNPRMSHGGLGDLDSSLRSFCEAPENRHIIEREQKKHLLRSVRLQQQHNSVRFRQKVLQSDEEAQRNIAPFLKSKVLREIVRSFTSNNDFEQWAKNAQVLDMLKEAQRLLDNGYVTEEQLQKSLLAHLEGQITQSEMSGSNEAAGRHRLGNEQLVGALNNHLLERRQGNQCYKNKDFETALTHYNQAVLILEPLQACAAEEQHEVDSNLVKAYLNIAAVYLNQQYFGKTATWCTKALKKDKQNSKALMRRAKAHLGRHNYQNAIADLSSLIQLDPSDLDAHALMQEARAKECADRGK